MQATGLDVTWTGEGPFTVFAPDNDAFTALKSYSPGTLEKLLLENPPTALATILTFHVAYGIITSDNIANGISSLELLKAENISIAPHTDSLPAQIANFA